MYSTGRRFSRRRLKADVAAVPVSPPDFIRATRSPRTFPEVGEVRDCGAPHTRRRCPLGREAVGSRRPILAHQGEGSEEESPDLLVTGLTGLGLAAPAELGSAPAGADPLARPEWLAADGAEAPAAACGRALHRRTCGFGRDLSG